MDFSWISEPGTWVAFLTLVALELVLGVDNVIFISILAAKLPVEQQQRARSTGIMLAVVTRVLLLLSLSWIIGLTEPLFNMGQFEISGRDLVLLAGGLFLLWKSVHEIHANLEGGDHEKSSKVVATMSSVISQIVVIDIVFSLDSVITAVGLVKQIGVMIAAVVIAMAVMLVSATAISDFVNRHPTIKMLALSFLLLVGVILVADGFGHHVEKGYIYFAMAFSFAVELLNMKMRGAKKSAEPPVELRQQY